MSLASYENASGTYTVYFNGNNIGTPNNNSLSDNKSFGKWTHNSGAGSLSGNTFTFGAGDARVTGSYSSDDRMTLPGISMKTNYIFEGWYTSSTGGTRVGGIGTSIKPSDYNGQTLYARGTYNPPKTTFRITYNPNGGSGGPGSDSAETTGSSGTLWLAPGFIPAKKPFMVSSAKEVISLVLSIASLLDSPTSPLKVLSSAMFISSFLIRLSVDQYSKCIFMIPNKR